MKDVTKEEIGRGREEVVTVRDSQEDEEIVMSTTTCRKWSRIWR